MKTLSLFDFHHNARSMVALLLLYFNCLRFSLVSDFNVTVVPFVRVGFAKMGKIQNGFKATTKGRTKRQFLQKGIFNKF